MTAVKSIGMTVADMDRSIDFYTTVLTFTKIVDRRITGLEAIDKLSLQTEQIQEMATIHLRVVVLQLGAETLDLTEFLTDKGRSIPLNSRSNDVWFQHLAIVVSNMHRAYQHVRQHAIVQISPQPQTLPDWNPVAGGIEAFYCQDPDGHNLELIHFPPDKGDPKWQQPTTDLFLGIDHTAIVVTDTAASRVFYCDLLGLKLQQESENFGLEQAQLSGVAHPRVKITSLKASAGIGIELLEYLEPNDGHAIPIDTNPNDLWCSQTLIAVTDRIETVQQLKNARLPIACAVVSPGTNSLEVDRQFLICDPDGHKIRLVDRS